ACIQVRERGAIVHLGGPLSIRAEISLGAGLCLEPGLGFIVVRVNRVGPALRSAGVEIDRMAGLHLGRALGTIAGIRQGIESLGEDRLVTTLATAIGSVFDPVQ